MDIDETEEDIQYYCSVCGIQENLQKCIECQQYICHESSCLDPTCLFKENWTCCFHCYQENMVREMENQMDESYIDQCIYCGNINHIEYKCNCYSYQLEDYLENQGNISIDINHMNLHSYEDQLVDSLENIHISSNN
jgi:hypothetical protein